MNPTANLNVGALVVVKAVSDNLGTTSAESTEHTVSDSKGNSWTKIKEWRCSSGAAQDGVVVSLWFTKVTTQILTTDTISLTGITTAYSKAIGADEYSVTSGAAPTVQNAAGTTGSSTTPSVATSGQPSAAYLFVGAVGIEGPNGDTFTQDTDYLNSTLVGTTGSTPATNVAVRFGDRVATLTGDTYNPTLGTSRDWTAVLGMLLENAPLTIAPVGIASTEQFGAATVVFSMIECEVGLSAVTDPGTSGGHWVRYRYYKTGTATMNLTVALKQGSSQIASWEHLDIGASVVQADQHLSTDQANNITDYAGLRLHFTANASELGAVRVTWAEMDVPSPSLSTLLA